MSLESMPKAEIIYGPHEKRNIPWTFEELNAADESGDKQGGNEDVMKHIIDRNIPEETRALLDFYQANNIAITKEFLDQVRPFEQQRFLVLRQMADVNTEDKAPKPEKSKLEKKLGIYLKNIEPQVRQAVIDMNVKGYHTTYSGFDFGGKQTIWCQGEVFANYQPSEQLLSQLQAKGIGLKLEPSRISFQPKEVLDMPELEKAWQWIVADLPN
jgi:hypothetical protein